MMTRAILLVACAVAVGGCAATVTAGAGEKGVRAAADRFYLALNAIFEGDMGPMERAWSHRDDVTYMGPTGGIQTGWTRVRANWQQQANMKLGGAVQPGPLNIVAGRDLAIVSNEERGENLDADGTKQRVSIRATTTFRREGGHWKVVGHHTDLLPFLGK